MIITKIAYDTSRPPKKRIAEPPQMYKCECGGEFVSERAWKLCMETHQKEREKVSHDDHAT